MSEEPASLTIQERKKKKAEFIRNEKNHRKDSYLHLISQVKLLHTRALSMIDSKRTYPPSDKSENVYTRKKLTELFRMAEDELESMYSFLTDTIETRPVNTAAKQLYDNPLFVSDAFVKWVADSRTKLGSKEIHGVYNDETLNKTLPYNGQSIGKVLLLTRDKNCAFEDEDGSTFEIDLYGLTSKRILNDLFHYYMNANNLKGVEIVGKDGEKKISRSFYRPDDNMKEHFGHIYEKIIEAERVKSKEKGTPMNVSMDVMPLNSVMTLSSEIIDKKRNADHKKELANPIVCDIVAIDVKLVEALYTPYRNNNKK